ncbi:Heme NO binding protein [Sulfitobacter sp. THAF37]|uniref:heme NO-binding domain-containing protein n=1 Tax=Sulfitobacter sp. THAF37 TaxID=2587855 RepID=UPI0012685561|nr:heme NO-binding domain-containing protein [Sulfitobacter sp. THAF37]QFT60486.1 Heme NO binding protein [Sulfitobacter sp. THAF37]
MHGLINRSIQNYICGTFGKHGWDEVVRRAGLEFDSFEAMLTYEDRLTHVVLDALIALTGRCREDLLEDFGTFLVADPSFEGVRRLLRFGGVTFADFLHSLDDLPDRARLAVPDLHLPQIELRAVGPGRYSLLCRSPVHGFAHVMVGVLRAMADDYGALALLEPTRTERDVETLAISLIEPDYAEGRSFELGARVG